MTPISSVSILGVRVDAVTMPQTLAWIADAVGAAADAPARRRPRQICTANPEFIMTARRDPEFRAVLNAADLVLPDGVGLLWAARWQGRRMPERVAGSDLIYRLAELASQHGWRVYFLGAAEGVAAAAAGRLKSLYPGLVIAGTAAGDPGPASAPAQVTAIQAARPDVLLVAYGAPAQDIWIARHKDVLGVPVSMGVGGSFDFVAGVAHRAPAWAQRLWLEWLHRLWRQPWRVRRVFNAVVAFPLAVLADGRSGMPRKD
jgi:N-acetylglucosaminyldiphosphoundecaprenol N-acetyl-beta-D-mannosaminyltransferase